MAAMMPRKEYGQTGSSPTTADYAT